MKSTLHFIGIGGTGMAPLAGIALEQGNRVNGSDLVENRNTLLLKQLGAQISQGHQISHLPPDASEVVYSSAVATDNPELAEARQRGISCLTRGEFLARLATEYHRLVAISGSHGKTTITAMLVWILRECGINCGYMIGGKTHNFPSFAAGNGDIFVTEADESDGSHTLLEPWLGIIPNIDDDHCWNLGGEAKLMHNFSIFAARSANLIYALDDHAAVPFEHHPAAINIAGKADQTTDFMELNAMLACRAANMLGVTQESARTALQSFPGVERRMTIHYQDNHLTIIEDYAHHPVELRAALNLLRKNYPKHHLRAVFQPHRYARLQKYLDNFAAELKSADSVFITPPFAAWTATGPVTAADLAAEIGDKAQLLKGSWTEIAPMLLHPEKPPLLLAVIGAGDIEQLIPELIRTEGKSEVLPG